jgi:hypothetical protein
MSHPRHQPRRGERSRLLYCCAVALLLALTSQAADPSAAWPEPTSPSRPWTRWWWLGDAVDRQGITNQLEAFHRAGIGGVEVTCIYGVKGQDAREITYLSPQWIEMIKHTCAEAHRLGMQVDLPPGSGWCMGGAGFPMELASANVVITTKSIDGGQSGEWNFGKALPQAIVAYGDKGEHLHLRDNIDAAGNLIWTAPPAGKWTIYVVTQKFSGQKVKRPAPGGEGPSFNAFSAQALDAALKPFDNLFDQLGPGAIRAQFHDSFEYQGNWTAALFPEFQKRLDYDLAEHLPALNGQSTQDENARVKADYRRVMADLLLEQVIQRWVEKAHAHGQLARNQAHGSPGNLLDLYAAADIPETEVFRDERDPLMAKFASSAAHVAGRWLCSSETFTWMAEHFTETLAQMKGQADFLLASGINHIVFHGTAYSPQDAAWPGWCFYASSEIKPQSPLWRDLPVFNAYLMRCQSILQAGKADNDVLLYWPIDDVWESGPAKMLEYLTVHSRSAFIERLPFGQVAAKLQAMGYAFDFVSDRQLRAAKVDGEGRLVLPGGAYRALVVPPCRRMSEKTLASIVELARAGATVAVIEHLPQDVPGFGHLEERRGQYEKLLAQAASVLVIGPKLETLLAKIERESLVDHPGLTFIRRSSDDGNQRDYFIVNQGKEPLDQWVVLKTRAVDAALMDPMTGRIGAAAVIPATAERWPQVYLQLQPGESIIVRTSAKERFAPETKWTYYEIAGEAALIGGNWKMQFVEGGPELPPETSTDHLASWTALGGDTAATQRFAGTARYLLTFDSPAGSRDGFDLDLGVVRHSARVRLNGQDLGTLFAPPYRVHVAALHPKGNELQIEVTNKAANRIRDLDRRKVQWRIFKDINFVTQSYQPFDASNWPVADSGLIGPVRLVPVARFQPKAP